MKQIIKTNIKRIITFDKNDLVKILKAKELIDQNFTGDIEFCIERDTFCIIIEINKEESI
jgi:phosphosulfolactate phosphohydrolase-like enzyme